SLENPESKSPSLSSASPLQDAQPLTSLEGVKPSFPQKEMDSKLKTQKPQKTKNKKKLETAVSVMKSPVLSAPVESSQFEGGAGEQSQVSTSIGDATSTPNDAPFSYEKFIQQLNIPEDLSPTDTPSKNALASSTPLTKNTLTGSGAEIVNQSTNQPLNHLASQSEIQPGQGLLSASPDYWSNWQRCNVESIYLESCTRYVP
ncbi:MAG: hypothetical protein K2X66_09180, partial [Cyanobacteria bacterium]|nr:hypothetical protein [Cyanobacteriota bacterium]